MSSEHSSALAGGSHPSAWPTETTRAVLLFLLVLSCAPPLIHFCLVDDGLDRLRSPFGLLPGMYLFLREFGQASACFPVAIASALGWSFFRSAHSHRLITIITAVFLIFTVAYAGQALVIIRLLLHPADA